MTLELQQKPVELIACGALLVVLLLLLQWGNIMADKFRYSFDLTKKLEEQLQQSMLASGQQAVTSSPGMMSADPPAKELQEAEQSKYDPYSFIQEYKDMLFSMFGGEEEYNKVVTQQDARLPIEEDPLNKVTEPYLKIIDVPQQPPVQVEQLEPDTESTQQAIRKATEQTLGIMQIEEYLDSIKQEKAQQEPDQQGLMAKPYDELRMREINEPLGEGLVSPDAGILSPRLDGKDGDLAAYVRPFTVTEEELYSFATESFPDNPLAAGALLATIEAESAGGDSMLESGNYTKENALKAAYQGTYKTARKKEVEKIFNNPDLTYTDKDGNIRMTKEGRVKFFNIYYNDKYRGEDYKLGNTKEGDGFRFRGRGPIQLTGKNNYKKYGDMIGVDLVQNPHLVVTDKDVALAVTKAYMKDKGLNNVRSASQLRNIVGHTDDEEATKAKARWKRAKEIQKKVTSLAPSTSLRPRSRPNTIMASN
jgi:predicted chitinase